MWVLLIIVGLFSLGCTKGDDKPLESGIEIISGEKVTTTPIIEKDSMKGTISKEDFPRIDGSTATIPLSESIYQYVTGASKEEAQGSIIHTKTSQSYYNLMEGNADLLIVYEPSQEVLDFQKKGNYKISKKPIGKDALVFMANKVNTIGSLTTEQLVQIYSGKATNWAEVGGQDSEILAFQRPEGSGSQTLMEKHVMKGEPMAKGVSVSYYTTMEGILEAMAQYNNTGNSLGYSVFYYAKNMYQLPELRFMNINGVEPSMETIYDNTYPYINEFYAVIREDEPADSTARRIYDWLTEEEGQQIVAEEGYVPVSMEFKEILLVEEEVQAKSIPEGYYYVATNKLWGDVSIPRTVSIYKDNWVNIAEFPGGEIYDGYGLQARNGKIVIGTQVGDNKTTALKFGLYDLSSLSYLIEPQYDNLWSLNEALGTYIGGNQMEYSLIDEKNKVLLTGFDQSEGMGISSVGDYYWLRSYDSELPGERITIYNSSITEVNQISKSYDRYGSYMDEYQPDGTPLVTREMFYDKMNISEEERALPYEFMVIMDVNRSEFISVVYQDMAYLFDYEWNLLLSKKRGSHEDEFYSTYDTIFSDQKTDLVTGEIIHRFYDKELKPLTTPTGDHYTNIVQENYRSYEDIAVEDGVVLYEIVGSKLYLYNTYKKETLEIDLGNWTEVNVVHTKGNLNVVKDREGHTTKIYYGNELRYTLDGDYYFSYSSDECSYLVLQNHSSSGIDLFYAIIDRNATMVYQSYYPESIKSIDDHFIQLHRGSYYMIIDHEGKVARKDYRPTLQDD